MNHGRVVQAAAPQVLFDHPLTEHVGRFIGSPAMNFLPAVVSGGRAVVPDTGIAMPLPPNLSTDGLTIGFRPETNGKAIGGKIRRKRHCDARIRHNSTAAGYHRRQKIHCR